MIIFISPAKTFKKSEEEKTSIPIFLEESKKILEELKNYTEVELGKLMRINSKLSVINYERYKNFSFEKNLFPAISSYDGIQYKSIELRSLKKENIDFLDEHLRIISGLYGVLKPKDGINFYRLEMLTKLKIEEFTNLYDFWGDKLYKNLKKNSERVIVNLASSEYSRAISKYIEPDITYIECVFKVNKNNKLRVESTASKKARGMMLKFIAENKINEYTLLKNFNLDGYEYNIELSEETENKIKYVFIKK